MNNFEVTLSYTFNVVAINDREAEEKALNAYAEIAPRMDEMNVSIKENNPL